MDLNASFGPNLKSASEILVLSDLADVQSLCKAHSEFQSIAEEARRLSLAPWLAVAEAAADLLQKIVLGDSQKPDEDLSAICAAVSAMQLACEGRELSEIRLPPALGVDMKAVKEAPPPSPPPVKAPPSQEQASSFAASCVANMHAAISSDASLVGDFVSESLEHLESCNSNLLHLESNPDDFEAINAVFRAFHTIKGVASFLNLAEVRNLAHQSESLLDKARAGKLALHGRSVDLIFESVDTMRAMIDDLGRGLKSGSVSCSVTKYAELIAGLEKACSSEAAPQSASSCPVSFEEAAVQKPASAPASQAPSELESDGEDGVQLPAEVIAGELPRFVDEMNEHLEAADKMMLELEGKPGDEESLNALFRCFHTIKGGAGFLSLAPVERLAHKAESLLGKAREGAFSLEGERADLCFQSIDAFKRISAALREAATGKGDALSLPAFPALELKLEAVCAGRPLAAAAIPPHHAPAAEIPAEEHSGDAQAKLSSTSALKKSLLKETVKVDAERLDRLVDTIGELVIAETMVVQSDEVRRIVSPSLVQTLSQLDKITRELQEMGMALRMVPISGTFQKMARLVRDLSKKIGKDVNFVMSGEDTELDKNVVDSIGDPLVHMVRNAVDHGIEASPEARVAAGKPAKGRVELRAFHKGGSIYIEVADDGKGLSKDGILKKAIERGLVQPGAELSDKDIFALIFLPGFSTAEKITEVSGRGVGMDVVKRAIEALRGQVEIQSAVGKGSVFSIKLPLTLAIIDGMVVSVAAERYIIPTLSIVMSVSVKNSSFKSVQGRGRMIQLQGELVPIFELSRLFEISSKSSVAAADGETLVVIVEDDGVKTGIAIDELLGQQQIVIKSLGDYLKGAPGISGGAIMPDGNVGLILDVGSLVRLANENM